MKKISMILIIMFSSSFVLADNRSDLQLYCQADPNGCRALLQQMMAQKMGVSVQPQQAPQVVYVQQPAYVQQTPTVYDQIREKQKTTYTNCDQREEEVNCTSQTQ